VTRPEPDRLLRQFERDGAIACALTAAAALVIDGGRPDGAVAVLAGGALSAASYLGIKRVATAALDVAARAGREREAGPAGEGASAAPGGAARAWLAVKACARLALLAVAAYVMLTCFKMRPVGLAAGATAPFLAAVAHLARSSRRASGRGRS
jgi:hypothetical protein